MEVVWPVSGSMSSTAPERRQGPGSLSNRVGRLVRNRRTACWGFTPRLELKEPHIPASVR